MCHLWCRLLSFSQQTKVSILRPNYGRWRWSPAQPRPSWNAIKTAPIWKDPEYAPLRATLSNAPVTVHLAISTDQAVQQLLLKSPSDPQRTITLTIYDGLEATVPASVASIRGRAAVALVEGSDWICPQIVQQMDHIPVLVYGAPEVVQRVHTNLRASHPTRTCTAHWVYIKPKNSNPQHLLKYDVRLMLIIGDWHGIRYQVRPSPHHPCWTANTPPSPSLSNSLCAGAHKCFMRRCA